VTAVIVGHDGAAWLAHGIDALLDQTRQVQRVVAVDTGSRDRSGTMLTAKLGQAAVFGMDRATGYAAAVRRALQHKAASAPLAASQAGHGSQSRGRSEQVEWLWLLHDDCEPAPDALEQLLRGAAEMPTAAVLGPKLMDWTDRDVILEAGLSLDTVGRRITGIEPREVDQGQHDGDRDALAVSSAGMLIRRDVWDQVGGFDPGMTLFGEDIDLCWRVHALGLRVRVITDAVVYHAMAATKGRRAISVGRRARLLDRRHGLLTLLGNLPTGPMLLSLVANLAISLLRTLFYTLAKRGTAALDELAAVAGVVGHPMRLASARRRRARGRRAAYGRVRADLPSGHSLRRAAEFVALVLARSGRPDRAAGHSAIDDPTDDDTLLTDTGFVQRFVTRPGVLFMLGLVIVTAVAERSKIGGGPLGGGALVPAWEGASQLWGEVLRGFHPAGIGSASAAPPYAGFVALLATVLAGKVWLAVDVLLLGTVPLAGLTAMLAMRRVTRSPRIRVWAAASYALLPVASGAVAAGRLGSAVAFALIPLIGLLAARMFSEPPRRARRAAWATGLAVTVGTAFVPVLWPMAVAAAVTAAVIMRRSRQHLVNLAIVMVTPLVLLLPWMMQLLAHPSGLLLEAGVQQPGLAAPNLPATSLLLLSPGGPGLPPYWVSAALLLTGLAALLATRRRSLIVVGWGMALLGFATALGVSRVVVTPNGGQAMTPWPGPALAVAAAGLLLAAAVGAEGLGRMLSARGRKGMRRATSLRAAAVAVLALAGVSAPVLAAGYWLVHGVTGPLTQASGEVVPALVAPSSGSGDQLRTLVLTSEQGHVSFLLLRGDSPQFTDPQIVPVAAAQSALTSAVGALVAPGGDEAANQSQLLARFDIGFVLMRAPLSAQLASVLDEVAGLSQVSMTPTFDLWRLSTVPSRVSVVEPDGAVVAIPSGPVSLAGAAAPATGGTLELAEPAGGWTATLDGHPLTSVPSPAGSWAQAFRLPPGGGTLAISRNGMPHDLIVILELLAFVVVAALALPGVRTAAELEAAASASGALALPAGGEADADTARAAEPGEADAPKAAPGRPAGPGRPARPERPGRGRAVAKKKPGRASRRSRGAQPAGEETVKPSAGRGEGRRAGAGKAAAGRADSGRAMATRTRAGLSRGAAGAAGASGAGASGAAGAAGAVGAAGAGAGAGGAPRAAWPAGQPASRFMSGPPPGSASYRPDSGEHAGPRAERPAPPASDIGTGRGPAPRSDRSPSGNRYDDFRAGVAAAGSRFDSGPNLLDPGSAGPSPDDLPVRGGSGPSAMPHDQRRVRPGPSPSGTRYDGLPAGDPAGRHPDALPARSAGTRSPSGHPYGDEPAAPGAGGPQRSYEPAADWREPGLPHYGSGGSGRPEPGWRDAQWRDADRDDSGRPDQGRRDAGWRDSGWHESVGPGRSRRDAEPPASRSWEQQPQHTSAWPVGDQPPSWQSDNRASAWPEPSQQHGRPEGYQPDYPPAPPPSGPAPAWNVPDQSGWAEQGDALEALPPIAEVHHEWPGRDDRPRRGWLAPDDEPDGEGW
jgi:GT2 family glycosyltransferase